MTSLSEIKYAINAIDSLIVDPNKGLPEDIFLLATRITPMVNVDLLIKNEKNQTLLTWRDDRYSMPGWHVPGGIIRFKETMAERVLAVARTELGAEVEFVPVPLVINELIHPERKERGHFISILYKCRLSSIPDESLAFHGGVPRTGQWMWHEKCPDNIISVHEIYREYIALTVT